MNFREKIQLARRALLLYRFQCSFLKGFFIFLLLVFSPLIQPTESDPNIVSRVVKEGVTQTPSNVTFYCQGFNYLYSLSNPEFSIASLDYRVIWWDRPKMFHFVASLLVFHPFKPCCHPKCFAGEALYVSLQLWPQIPIISTKKTPFVECIIPLITSYNW